MWHGVLRITQSIDFWPFWKIHSRIFFSAKKFQSRLSIRHKISSETWWNPFVWRYFFFGLYSFIFKPNQFYHSPKSMIHLNFTTSLYLAISCFLSHTIVIIIISRFLCFSIRLWTNTRCDFFCVIKCVKYKDWMQMKVARHQ